MFSLDGVTGDICPIGHYCPEGIDRPLPCLNATYMNRTGAAECLDCPAGSYCTQGDRPDPCPAGYYCPMGTGFDTRPCPEGTYGASESLRTESECSACTGGSYCDTPGMDSVTADCDPGFFCLSGEFSNTFFIYWFLLRAILESRQIRKLPMWSCGRPMNWFSNT